MTSKIKVDNINKVSDDTNIIKKCGTTTTIGSGASNPIVVDGSAVTLGRCGGTVALASGATQTGFGRTGTVNWITTKKTTGFTAVSGEGYFCDTAASGAFTLTLPSSPSAGDIVGFKDYNGNFASANLTIGRNGSPINGGNTIDVVIATAGASIFLVYVDATQGWVATQDDESVFAGSSFICATGGTKTTSGNDTIHTFTGPGTFTVNSVSNCAPNNVISYMIVGGGGGAAGYYGGGGAGGFREVKSPVTPYTASPLDGYPSSPNRVTVTAQGYSIVVGAGGAAVSPGTTNGNPGNNSSGFGITAALGGHGSGVAAPSPGAGPGGSGGGEGYSYNSKGTGNTPPTTPPQGNDGGEASPVGGAGGGGGGATAVGANGASSTPSSDQGVGGAGGAGATTSINGTPTAYAGGGGGGGVCGPGAGGTGGGGTGQGGNSGGAPAQTGAVNTGGGGGARGSCGSGGSGIVIIRYKTS